MFTIGDFARLGRVSVRMLRHYDAIGLLRPARVDGTSGYRFYGADQLARLNRIVALKDLGFTLQQVQVILDEKVDVSELRGMLRLRRAQLEDQVAADLARLAGVAARLRLIESEGHMITHEVVLKSVAAVRVASRSGIAASYAPEHIGPALTPLYPELCEGLERARVKIAGPGIAYYDNVPGGGDAVQVHAAFPVSAEPSAGYDFDVVDLPAIESAATLIHHGSMDGVDETYQALARWIDENGYRTTGSAFAREVYLDCPDDLDKWVTELQLTVTRI
ncbi:MAG TPA: MerR family transcriptional regulator [Micromonosporaceae bacterium]|nr:MerR family transcriptional regulator [Micromonosporaceae bacterium]